MSATVGFIGLGQMGCSMARNLIRSGHRVIAFDIHRPALDALVKDGATAAENPKQVASECSKIVTMLPEGAHVRKVYLDSDGLLQSVKKGSLLLDCTTADVATSQHVAEIAKQSGATYMDAPVSGGVVAAANAKLTFMVGGPKDTFSEAESLLSKMGQRVYHCGDVGTGQTVKICNNMMLAISMIGASETLNLGDKLGVDPELLTEIISSATGRCWSIDTYNPVPGVKEGVPSSKNYEGGFATELMAKDLGLAQMAATSTKSPTPLGSLAHQLYRSMCQKGLNKKDFSVAYQFIKE